MTRPPILRLDGKDYDLSTLSAQGREALAAYQHATAQMQHAQKMQALLIRAKNAYVEDLKAEIVQGKTGLDLAALFGD
ncbi:hypothetical protein EV663_10622 [Rhodovulum bhavnagarense]|uniref:Uncharacterized protein n=1 Tax=Rhodovulum bhavnagarense TaxID=992286 RepID=A0A4V2SW51_9RHOB|nr:DUF6447 family protein [Rhodovulum bhavnagarense]TCP61076.1 hypothetical protein EV663_10622 [Rhodovulum bhavnagarense]